MEIKRGYVKYTDDNGVIHKDLLTDHPELLKTASPREQLAAEEARRLNAAAEEVASEEKNTLVKSVPEYVLSTSELVDDLVESEPLSTTKYTPYKATKVDKDMPLG